MRDRDPYVEHLLELLTPVGEPTARRMFGGWGLYVDGVMVVLVADEMAFLKVDDESKPAFTAAGSSPFLYSHKGREISMSYWSVPDAALDSPEAMQPWAQLALEAARRKAAAKPARRKPATRRLR